MMNIYKSACFAVSSVLISLCSVSEVQAVQYAPFESVLDFSPEAVEAFELAGVVLGTRYASTDGQSITFQSGSVVLSAIDEPITASEVYAYGFFSLTAPLNFAGDGGYVEFGSLRFDVPTATLYVSARGYGPSQDGIALFTGTVTKNLIPREIIYDWVVPPNVEVFHVSNLVFTQEGKDLFTRSLGLNATGQSIFDSVSQFGSLTLTTPVPEPSTWALSLLGLAAAGALARRRSTADVGAVVV